VPFNIVGAPMDAPDSMLCLDPITSVLMHKYCRHEVKVGRHQSV
jgi:hypothetical protein